MELHPGQCLAGRPEFEGPVSLLRLFLHRWQCSARPLAMRAVGGPVGRSSHARAAPPYGQTDLTLLSLPRKCPNDMHAGLASAQAPAPAASCPSYVPLALEDLLPLTPHHVLLGLSRPRLSLWSPPPVFTTQDPVGRRLAGQEAVVPQALHCPSCLLSLPALPGYVV